MVRQKKSMIKRLDDSFIWDHRTIGTFFLGVGFVMFVLNITSILQVMAFKAITYPMNGYYVSVISSLFLMGYSLYNIYKKSY